MRLSLVPDGVWSSYRRITPELLTEYGVKLLLCDLDYTLAPRSVSRPDAAVRLWLHDLHEAGITVMILSNNRRSARVELFCHDLGIAYEGHAGKPFGSGFQRAMQRVGVTAAETAMLGDKLLTDVLAAHFNGVLALMVEPSGGAKSAWQKVLHTMQAPFKALSGGLRQ